MDDKNIRKRKVQLGFKGELVPEKDDADMTPSMDYTRNNPYKTPPNNLSNKRKYPD